MPGIIGMSQNLEKIKIPQATAKGWIYCYKDGCFDMSFPTSKLRRGRVQGLGGRLSLPYGRNT